MSVGGTRVENNLLRLKCPTQIIWNKLRFRGQKEGWVVRWLDGGQGGVFLVEKQPHRLSRWCRRAASSPRRTYGMSCRRDGGERQINCTSLGRKEAVHGGKLHRLDRGYHSCKDGTHFGRWDDNRSVSKGQASYGNGGRAAQLEGGSPACRGQHCSVPAGHHHLQTQAWAARSSDISRKARKLELDLKSHLL